MAEHLGEAWFRRWTERLESAVEANRLRHAWSPFQESPSKRLHPEGSAERGHARFLAALNQPFALDLPGQIGRVGTEVSPYTGEPLGITYPRVDVDALYAAIGDAWPAWRASSRRARAGVCLELLERWHQMTFENAYATMHTAGQGFMLAFAGSGASSLDRGLEALAMAWTLMSEVPETATFERSFGRDGPVRLHKQYRLMPVGVAVVLSCGSYPAWNAYPAILANLVTGNPVVVKPHPDTILPVAMAVRVARSVLSEAGFDPNPVSYTHLTLPTKRIV